jgi:single-strand DNA-binding protein
MARSLNRALLIGNLTRDPELRYTGNGTAVCSFGLATNRSWTADTGEKKEDTEFHNIVAWNKLAEVCSEYLTKGRKAYVEGRLSTRTYTGKDGQEHHRTEVVIEDMIILDNKGAGQTAGAGKGKAAKPTAKPKTEEPKAASTAETEPDQFAKDVDDILSSEELPF